MEAGEKFKREAVQIVGDDEPEVVSLRSRYGLRGPKLYLILATIIMIAILVVVGKRKSLGRYYVIIFYMFLYLFSLV